MVKCFYMVLYFETKEFKNVLYSILIKSQIVAFQVNNLYVTLVRVIRLSYTSLSWGTTVINDSHMKQAAYLLMSSNWSRSTPR